MTWPGVTATSRPTLKASVPKGFSAANLRRASSMKFAKPVRRLAPPLAMVLLSISGLVARKFDGPKHVEKLTRSKFHLSLVLRADAADVRGGIVRAPLLVKQLILGRSG